MEKKIPVVAFAAWSGTGKTTLVEALIMAFKQEGLRVAAIKHDAHRFEIDREGKDSWRFTNAGADMTIVSSPEKTAVIEQRPRTLRENLEMIHDVDLILVEGYKTEDLPRIGISRKATGKGLPGKEEWYLAIVSDEEPQNKSVPHFELDDIQGIKNFILSRLEELTPTE